MGADPSCGIRAAPSYTDRGSVRFSTFPRSFLRRKAPGQRPPRGSRLPSSSRVVGHAKARENHIPERLTSLVNANAFRGSTEVGSVHARILLTCTNWS